MFWSAAGCRTISSRPPTGEPGG